MLLPAGRRASIRRKGRAYEDIDDTPAAGIQPRARYAMSGTDIATHIETSHIEAHDWSAAMPYPVRDISRLCDVRYSHRARQYARAMRCRVLSDVQCRTPYLLCDSRAKPKPGTALPKPYVMPSIVQYLVLTFCTALPGTTGNQCAGYGTLGELRYLPTRTLCNVQ
eukprot:2282858-Rhodomonas_salina.3